MATKQATNKKPTPKTKADAAKAGADAAGKAIAGVIKAANAQPAAEKEVKPRPEVEAAAGKVAAPRKTKAAKPASKETQAKKDGDEKKRKIKLVRDSFALPEAEYNVIGELKKRCVAQGLAVKKSEVLRAAIANLAALSDDAVSKALAKVVPIKTGRPPKHAK